MHDPRAAALAALPAHPVFGTDLDEGIVAVAVRFDARHQTNAGSPFPTPENCYILLLLLELAQSTPLGALVDFSPLMVLLCEGRRGFERTRRGLHESLDCLAQLAMDPGHVITPDDPHADLAIQRLLAALHMAIFESMPLSVRAGDILGCKACANMRYQSGPSWIARVVGEAHAAGRLAPGYRLPTALELAAATPATRARSPPSARRASCTWRFARPSCSPRSRRRKSRGWRSGTDRWSSARAAWA